MRFFLLHTFYWNFVCETFVESPNFSFPKIRLSVKKKKKKITLPVSHKFILFLEWFMKVWEICLSWKMYILFLEYKPIDRAPPCLMFAIFTSTGVGASSPSGSSVSIFSSSISLDPSFSPFLFSSSTLNTSLPYWTKRNINMSNEFQGCERICEKKSELIWNAWKDVLFNALKPMYSFDKWVLLIELYEF